MQSMWSERVGHDQVTEQKQHQFQSIPKGRISHKFANTQKWRLLRHYEKLPTTRKIFRSEFLELALSYSNTRCFPNGSSGKEPTCTIGDSGDTGSISVAGRSHGGGNGIPLLYSCLENSMDRGTKLSTVHRGTKSQT